MSQAIPPQDAAPKSASQPACLQLPHASGSPLAAVLTAAEQLAKKEAPVLLIGESGTGKELLARAIHQDSARHAGPFVALACDAIPEALLGAELFGEVKDGVVKKRGRVAAADGGTLFLDEVAALPPALQWRLCQFLQDGSYERSGAQVTETANVRIVTATRIDLLEAVEDGRVRRDLFYKIASCPLLLPTLRDRRGDIEPLFRAAWIARGETRPFEPSFFAPLLTYPWPGNLRELHTLVERVAVCSTNDVINVDDLPAEYRGQHHDRPTLRSRDDAPASAHLLPQAPEIPMPVAGALSPMNLTALLRTIEFAYIDAALAQTDGNRQAAASLLGLQRTTLVEKLRRRGKDTDDGTDPAQMS